MAKLIFQYIFLLLTYFWIFRPTFLISFFETLKPIFLGTGGFKLFLLASVLVWGISFIFWGFVGILRYIADSYKAYVNRNKKQKAYKNLIKKNEVAIIVPAHNEALVIADTLTSLLKITKKENIYVVSDGSKDKTVEIAQKFKVNVLDLNPSHGKAGAMEACIKHFEIAKKYKAVVLVDADTRLKSDYLDHALPLFNNKEVVAVAGYAATIWNPEKLSWRQLLFVAHRDRVYFLFQTIVKFGQTWKYFNVTHIVPGFASMYRTSILPYLTINPKGIVIEDFNMTFEVHHKNLGIIAHDPRVVGYTQDPDNAGDYYRQIKRWHLGFWQTIRLHGVWPSKFWISISLTLIETILGSLMFLLLPIFLVVSFISPEFFYLSEWPPIFESGYLLKAIFLGVWLSDYLLTIIAAMYYNRKEYLLVGLFFPIIRVIDAVAFLTAIPKAFLTKSNGRWISPSRRAS